MGNPSDKQRLLSLLYEARNAPVAEKAEAYRCFQQAVEEVAAGTPYSYQQIKLLLLSDGYAEYAKRRRIQEQNGF